ncbi:MAG: di-trans,poly-cis-decaprenylcistransferase [Proteobacteria bacterium]|nr:MAG: di-trans,poly-cis-decaprenylcistransferase [Pseudomonadota bacterium]
MSSKNTLNHLAIIMDGNGRWAEKKGKIRTKGHEEGAKNVRKITEYVAKSDIRFLTLYAFSTENWNRPEAEVKSLMKLLEYFLKKERKTLVKNNIRFRFIGDISNFSQKLKDELLKSIEVTKNCTGLTQILALNYGSKDEIARAVKRLLEKAEEVSEENISKNLDTSFAGDVDLLIRTGGQMRLSNFLLWQSAYAELRYTDTLWPEFRCEELDEIINLYKKVHRRFGGL